MLIELSKVPPSMSAFITERLSPTIPAGPDRDLFNWVSAGAVALSGTGLFAKYVPALKSQGIITEDDHVDTDKLRCFLDGAFDKQSSVTYPALGHKFTLDRSDGEAFLRILEA